ncbi:vesicle-associated membrane protein 3-like isoform X2 [Takifugu rubripes]|uniref:vesicle-associated membrane protein 3-like isoform X2 n=1 Tax=Takifugu rubripes TaxID=31033 RepID=UPI001145EE4A|nr:vesicle-associated membrane protein 3-like isoform X2 [Takifugu rubripes]
MLLKKGKLSHDIIYVHEFLALHFWSATDPDSFAAMSSNRNVQQTQVQVDEVVDIMQVSVDKELKSDQELSELNDQPDVQQARDSQVETSADKLKRKYWWKNMKLPREQIWGSLIYIIVIAIIILILYLLQ